MAEQKHSGRADAADDVRTGEHSGNISEEASKRPLTRNGEHPLQTGWTFWYDKKVPKKAQDQNSYQASLHKAGSFNTVEGFWKNYVHLKRPSKIVNNVNVYLFRDAQEHVPMWERYPNGGCWILRIRKKAGHSNTSVLGKMWQDLVLAVIGEMFEEPNVVGIGMAIRSREDLLSVWNEDNTIEKVRFIIGEKLKQVLDLEPSTLIEYKHHQVAIQDHSTFRNAQPYVFTATKSQSQGQAHQG
ncbi:unnamed protein product [Ascophyllum nodosum]